MKTIKVLGSGCTNCATTATLIQQLSAEMNQDVKVEKVEDIAAIMGYGVMSTPAVVIDETVVHAGSIPDKATIKTWLAEDTSNSCCADSVSNSGCC